MTLHQTPDNPQVGKVRCTLAADRRPPGNQRAIDNIAVPHHPANVGHTEKDVFVFHIPKRFKVVVRPHHIATVNMLHAFGTPGGTGIENVERVL